MRKSFRKPAKSFPKVHAPSVGVSNTPRPSSFARPWRSGGWGGIRPRRTSCIVTAIVLLFIIVCCVILIAVFGFSEIMQYLSNIQL